MGPNFSPKHTILPSSLLITSFYINSRIDQPVRKQSNATKLRLHPTSSESPFAEANCIGAKFNLEGKVAGRSPSLSTRPKESADYFDKVARDSFSS